MWPCVDCEQFFVLKMSHSLLLGPMRAFIVSTKVLHASKHDTSSSQRAPMRVSVSFRASVPGSPKAFIFWFHESLLGIGELLFQLSIVNWRFAETLQEHFNHCNYRYICRSGYRNTNSWTVRPDLAKFCHLGKKTVANLCLFPWFRYN